MSNDLDEQMKERRARYETTRRRSSETNQMDIDLDHTSSSSTNKQSRIRELQDSIQQRKQRINGMNHQIQQLQEQCNNETAQCQREEEELKHLEDETRHHNPNENVIMSEAVQPSQSLAANPNASTSSSVQAGTQSQQPNVTTSQQIMPDEEVARYLAAQFEQDEQEAEQYLTERTITEPQTISQYSTFQNDPNSGGGISFQFSSSRSSLPAVGSRTTVQHGQGDTHLNPLESFFGNDDLLVTGNPFPRTNLGGLPFSLERRQREDPFSDMRLSPMFSFPGMMFGGALMNENMDYETLMRLFPPAPRGAQSTDIEQLPVDTFKAKPQESETQKKEHTHVNEKKEEEEKKEKNKQEDEFTKCCICLESFKDGEEIRRLPCLHIFHTAEIDEWLLRNHLCPICRTPIEQNEEQQTT